MVRRANKFVVATAALVSSVSIVPAFAQSIQQSGQNESSVTLDRVVAVVNRQAILDSDVEDEMQLSVLDPNTNSQQKITPQQALEQLISRTLIQQQVRQEDAQASEPKPEEIAARLQEIRNQLPACVHADCQSEAGWSTFLAHHELTPQRVENYLRNRLEILSFIELRFRQGIRITPEEVEAYYRTTLLPQFSPGEKTPTLEQVSPRIQEILLEQQVNVMFDSWLANLRKQGQIEVLDPSLEQASGNGAEGATKE
jgi:hypothetical protein